MGGVEEAIIVKKGLNGWWWDGTWSRGTIEGSGSGVEGEGVGRMVVVVESVGGSLGRAEGSRGERRDITV